MHAENIRNHTALHGGAALGEPGLARGGEGGLDEPGVADGRPFGLESGAGDVAFGPHDHPHNDLAAPVAGISGPRQIADQTAPLQPLVDLIEPLVTRPGALPGVLLPPLAHVGIAGIGRLGAALVHVEEGTGIGRAGNLRVAGDLGRTLDVGGLVVRPRLGGGLGGPGPLGLRLDELDEDGVGGPDRHGETERHPPKGGCQPGGVAHQRRNRRPPGHPVAGIGKHA